MPDFPRAPVCRVDRRAGEHVAVQVGGRSERHRHVLHRVAVDAGDFAESRVPWHQPQFTDRNQDHARIVAELLGCGGQVGRYGSSHPRVSFLELPRHAEASSPAEFAARYQTS